jgi:hypothetical protein
MTELSWASSPSCDEAYVLLEAPLQFPLEDKND